jgi:hypothetical protein
MRIVPAPVPVRIVSAPFDLATWLSFIAAVIALVIAVAAIWVTRRQAIVASQQIARERRTVFELEVLRQLLVVDSAGQVFNVRPAALIEALPSADLPLWRELISFRGRGAQPPDFHQGITEILDRRGAPPDQSLDGRLWKALVDDVKTSITARVQDG